MRRGVSVPVPERAGARHVILAQSPRRRLPRSRRGRQFMECGGLVIAGALDRAATEQELRRRALEDPLTGLANRALLASQLDAELRHARRLDDRVCVLVLDLDRFKIVNDTLGQQPATPSAQGRGTVARLRARGRLVARPGGDEFTVLYARR